MLSNATGTFNIGLLHQELSALPGMIGTINGERLALYRLYVPDDTADGVVTGTVTVEHPDGVSVRSVLDTHNSGGRSNDQQGRESERVEKVALRNKLKTPLWTGLTDRELELLGLPAPASVPVGPGNTR